MRIALTLLMLSVPAPGLAWGFDAHKFIADRMIELLPPELKPLFAARRAFIVERAIDPDLWRTVGWQEEPPNHFLDMDHEAFGPYPFNNLPRDYDEAVQRFGRDFIHTQGLLPWRTSEFWGQLRREFESLKRPSPPGYALDNIALFSAVLAHYVADGHVPLHAVVNYNGQLTGQDGVHSRWETELFQRHRARLKIAPPPLTPIRAPRDAMFDVLLTSNRAAATVLESDRKAAQGREFYDEVYFEAFAGGTLPTLERRLNDSISAVASFITGAWEAAGKPVVPTELPRTPRPIRRPK
ncbi:MAG TPA: hypothetical protein VJ691_02125 [Vicinamibacterales bacterium]|nr:hypothetical protein [Vicinamibacterales bacterium]